MRKTSPIGKPEVIATEGSSIQGVSVPKTMPEAHLKPMDEVLRQVGLTDEPAAETPAAKKKEMESTQ